MTPGETWLNRTLSLARKIYRRTLELTHFTALPRLVDSGYSPGPTIVYFQLTYKCNLRCSFCGQWGDTGLYKSLPGSQLKQMLPLAVLQRVINELGVWCHSVGLWGGETLDYPDIIPLVRAVKRSGRECSLVTNGTSLAEIAKDLVEAGTDAIYVSIDAEEKTHDALRGAGTFGAAVDGIRKVRAERLSRRLPRPVIIVSTIMIPAAVGELPALIRHMRAEGVDSLEISRLQYATQQQGDAHDGLLQKLVQFTPGSWKGVVRQPEPDAPQKVKAIVEELRADPANKNFVDWDEHSWSPQDLFKYYADPNVAVPTGRACGFPWRGVNICPNGDVSPCPYPHFAAGNAQEESFSKIWNGPRFRDFRRKLAGQGRFPICSSCCHLYD
jgi:radical SAM protein with 4Fe4S-binding SPASM domain